jgi:aminoglycoside phosphotransferase (APT) family kinase protein
MTAFHVDAAVLQALLHECFGTRCRPERIRDVTTEPGYRVLMVELSESGGPHRTVAVKLCAPDDPRAAGFARAAAFARLVRERTDVPTYEVLAVDATGKRWPWAYLVTSHIAGWRCHEVVPSLEAADKHALYEQLGRAVAGLHSLRFPSYGEMGADGAITPAPTYLDALATWAEAHITDSRHRALFLRLLAERADLFAGVGPPQLTHEDLNPNNLLVRRDGDGWRLVGALDFDKAWAGCGESDLARLELWRGMTGNGFWQGYTSQLPVPADYPARRALYQLLWCLEYARPTPRHIADTAAVCAALGLPPVVFTGDGTAYHVG